MRATRFAFASLLFIMLLAPASLAQFQRTFVSGLGSDGNPCTRTAPCRTFAQAVSQTNAGGEVVALDSAGYGAFTVAKSVSVSAPPGVYAGISAPSVSAEIGVFAGSSDAVTLRGLSITQLSTEGVGINCPSAIGALRVQGCSISAPTAGIGIVFNGPGNLFVEDTRIADCNTGILLQGGSASIDHAQLECGKFGLALSVSDGTKASIRGSVISGNGSGGIFAIGGINCCPPGPSEINVEACVIANNGIGIQASGQGGLGGTVRVSNSTVTDNGTGLQQMATGVILSRQNNTVEGNTTNTSGTIGSYTAK